ncbi:MULTISPECIES: DUF167 domain-containing protein [unclassified Ruegeria]|uniref:DUF167 domain-containing protein n=1 Tax=unclassified Ruegeria TaxID=2625375 RepID=UPI001ADB71A5|nr:MULTISPECIES: DUF167 domain-containing protein [unclassified Ruegeria]MBO9411112.1 DUF167 domain-containing protein [Ruegeria sp. R8_1]MBO9415313.1 DUF167 domain-containing protein [Ruegeria sp. R8_2]
MAKPKLRNVPDLTVIALPGAEINVKVTPKAALDRITLDGGLIRVYVTAPPTEGKANDAVRRVLAIALGVPATSLKLRRGQTSRDKLFVYDP